MSNVIAFSHFLANFAPGVNLEVWKTNFTNCLRKFSDFWTSQRWGMTISCQVRVKNSRGSLKIKNLAQKKLVSFAPSDWYLNYTKIGVKLPWTELFDQDLKDKNCFFGKCIIQDSNFKNKMSYVKKFCSFQLFVDFLTDSDSPAIKFVRTGFR